MSKNAWTRVGSPQEFPPGTLHTRKSAGHQLVVGRTDEGTLFALDNRCPHEGYPLAQGELKTDLLTCMWHNWKFRVGDGACVIGGEGVRYYPVREREGVVEVDLAPPDPVLEAAKLRESLGEALFDQDVARALRDGIRLLHVGVTAEELAVEVAHHDARCAEYGTTHALAVAADCTRFLPRYRGPEALVALAPAIDMCAEANRRLAPRAVPGAIPWEGVAALRAAVLAEEAERAQALVRGAFEAGLARAELDEACRRILADHFTDFGHQLIYLVKLQELVERAGEERPEVLADLYGGLVYSAVLGTREDTLPYWEPYTRRFGAAEGRLDAWASAARPDTTFDEATFRAAVLDGHPEEACAALFEALDAGVAASRIACALVLAATERLLRFDPAIDADPDVAETWLWATHRLTFAAAVRHTLERSEAPDALRFLFQAVGFLHSGRAMDLGPDERAAIAPEPADAQDVLAAIAARDAAAAVNRAAGCLAGGGVEALRTALEDLALRDPLVRPIVVAHVVKTTVVAFEEYEALAGWPGRERPILALVRFLASPIVERRVHGAARLAVRWVSEGKMPRKLTQ